MMMNLNWRVISIGIAAFVIVIGTKVFAVGDLWLSSNLGRIPAESSVQAHIQWVEDEEDRSKSAPIHISLIIKGSRKVPESVFRFATTRENISEEQIGPESYIRTTKEPLEFKDPEAPFKMIMVRSEANFTDRNYTRDDHYRHIVQKAILFRDNQAQVSIPFGELREEYTEFLYSQDLMSLHDEAQNRPWKRGDGLPRLR